MATGGGADSVEVVVRPSHQLTIPSPGLGGPAWLPRAFSGHGLPDGLLVLVPNLREAHSDSLPVRAPWLSSRQKTRRSPGGALRTRERMHVPQMEEAGRGAESTQGASEGRHTAGGGGAGFGQEDGHVVSG